MQAGVTTSLCLRATAEVSDLPVLPEGSRGFLPLLPFFGIKNRFFPQRERNGFCHEQFDVVQHLGKRSSKKKDHIKKQEETVHV